MNPNDPHTVSARFYRLWLSVLCLILLLVGSGLAIQQRSSPIADANQATQAPLSLPKYFAVLEDPELALTLSDVQQVDIAATFKTDLPDEEAMSFGFTHSAYWLRLRLQNSAEQPVERMLDLGTFLLSSVQFFQPMADGTYSSVITGQAKPFDTRAYPNRNFVFPLTLPASSDQVFYLRIQSADAITIPARLWDVPSFHAYERDDYLLQAWYFGMASAMILFNLLLFLALREFIYLLYVNFVTCAALGLAAQNGLGHEFLWPAATQWSNVSVFVGFALSLATILMFMRHMLDTQKLIPGIDKLIRYLVVTHLLLTLCFFLSLQTFSLVAEILNLATALLVLAVSAYCAVKGQRSAYFFVAAFTLLMLGGFIHGLRDFGLVPTNIFTVNALQIGSALEMILLAFALADRFNVIRMEKATAQREKLAAQQQLVVHLQNSERELEARVAQRTDELHLLNIKLEKLSATDALTGIANRRRFDETLESEWNRASRAGQPLALALIDVDWFKNYNDHYGHQAGDECLHRVAEVLSSTLCRTGDLVARYGGEEFVFIAPSTTGENALNMAKKVCENLQRLALPHELSAYGCLTVSIGVAGALPREGCTAEDLLKAADEALYSAKQQGRNRALLAA